MITSKVYPIKKIHQKQRFCPNIHWILEMTGHFPLEISGKPGFPIVFLP